MAQVTIQVAGRSHIVACRDGDEPQLRALAATLDSHSDTALRASGGLSAEKTLLYIALILADQVAETERSPPTGIPPMLLDRIADRLEAVATALEEEPQTS